MKKLAIIGSTGSIGTQALEIVRANRKDICVTAMSAGRNIELFAKQIREFQPQLVSVAEEADVPRLKEKISGEKMPEILCGLAGMTALAAEADAQTVLTAVVGMVGIAPTIAAIRAGKDIALANKETLVCAGHIIMPLAKKTGVRILPVDSEHSAIFQSLRGQEGSRIEKILLTASGGPFFGKKKEELSGVTPEQALRHPNWSMGKKITIDSATLVNKGLELIEARWLFDVAPEDIEIVVHPQSVLHSAVQFTDGAVIGQMGTSDMKIPIQYALFYPQRRFLAQDRLDLFSLGQMTFALPDLETFRGPALAREAIRVGGSLPTILNAANEKAVAMFLARRIGFLQIAEIIEECMTHIPAVRDPDTETIDATQADVLRYIDSRW